MITTFVTFFSAINIILSLIMIQYNWKINKNVIFLSLFLTVYSLENVAYSIFIYGGNTYLYTVLFIISPLFMIKAPMLYLFVRGISNDKFYFKTIDILHFLPFFIHLISNSSYLLFPWETKVQISLSLLNDYELFKNLDINTLYPLYLNNQFRAVQFFLYVIVSLIVVIKARKKYMFVQGITDNQIKYVTSRLIFVITIILFLTIIQNFINFIYIFYNRDVYTGYFITVLLQSAVYLYFAITLYIFLNPRLLYGMPRNSLNKLRYNETIISENPLKMSEYNDDAYFQVLAQRINTYLNEEKPYLKQNFNPLIMAAYLQVPEHHIHFCLSDVMHTRFNKLKNQRRIEYAIKLKQIDDYSNATLKQLSDICGFMSVAAFKNAYREVTGNYPDQWR